MENGVLNGKSTRRPLRALVLLVVVALLAAACGSAEPTTTLALTDDPTESVASRQVGAGSFSPDLEQAPAPGVIAAAPAVEEATVTIEDPASLSTWVATATDQVTHLVAYDAPGGAVIPFEFLVPHPHQFGGPQALMVTQGEPGDDWVEVQLPIRPNGQTGWIDASLYTFSETQVRAEVNLTARSVTIYDGTDIIAQTEAVIGSAQTPTPLGTFFITAKRRSTPEETFLGPWALALSAFSEVHDTFSGGLPVIAIHGTDAPHQVGDARSNGCLRIPNDVVTLLAETVPLGAPVTITA